MRTFRIHSPRKKVRQERIALRILHFQSSAGEHTASSRNINDVLIDHHCSIQAMPCEAGVCGGQVEMGRRKAGSIGRGVSALSVSFFQVRKGRGGIMEAYGVDHGFRAKERL
jgi:hypothetical protein